MLSRENKFFVLCSLFFILCFLFSCNNEEKKTQEQRNMCFIESVKAIGIEKYYNVYNQANDTINTWIKNNWGYLMQKSALEWQLDSLICFDKGGKKCIMSIMNRESEKVNNSINHFYGVWIKEKWYFFCGPTLYAFSEYYGLQSKVPLSFEKLKQIATAHIYRGYLKKGKNGQWEINENFFQDVISANKRMGGYGSCFECKTEEEYVLYRIRMNWASRDTTNAE
jgi:hypothetical protein